MAVALLMLLSTLVGAFGGWVAGHTAGRVSAVGERSVVEDTALGGALVRTLHQRQIHPDVGREALRLFVDEVAAFDRRFLERGVPERAHLADLGIRGDATDHCIVDAALAQDPRRLAPSLGVRDAWRADYLDTLGLRIALGTAARWRLSLFHHDWQWRPPKWRTTLRVNLDATALGVHCVSDETLDCFTHLPAWDVPASPAAFTIDVNRLVRVRLA